MTEFDEIGFTAFGTHLAMYGEPLVYRPKVGRPRTILCVVNRKPLTAIAGVQDSIAPMIEIEAYNDEFQGIASGLLDTGGDKVDVSFRKDGEVTTRPITRLICDRFGTTRFEVR